MEFGIALASNLDAWKTVKRAEELGISLNALRNRALRLRAAVERCVRERLSSADRDEYVTSDTLRAGECCPQAGGGTSSRSRKERPPP